MTDSSIKIGTKFRIGRHGHEYKVFGKAYEIETDTCQLICKASVGSPAYDERPGWFSIIPENVVREKASVVA